MEPQTSGKCYFRQRYLIVLIRRRSRIVECANLLRLLDSAGESGLSGNINFA